MDKASAREPCQAAPPDAELIQEAQPAVEQPSEEAVSVEPGGLVEEAADEEPVAEAVPTEEQPGEEAAPVGQVKLAEEASAEEPGKATPPEA